MSDQFVHLTSPISIGNMWLKNRMVMSPMTTTYAGDNQLPSERLLSYLEERAKGGIGLITTEVVTVDEVHRYISRSLTLGSDKYIDPHKRITDIVHQYGCKIQPLLCHAGPESISVLYGKAQAVGPSVNVAPVWGWSSRQLLSKELPLIARQFGDAALRAKMAGYDGIELNAAHGETLLGAFLSPLRNKRTDEYSGFKSQTRLRFIKEVVYEIKSRAGDDFPVTLAVSGYERTPGGRSIDNTQLIAPELVTAGVDCFRVSGGVTDSLMTQPVSRSGTGEGINVSQARAIKQVVDVPVIVVGRIHDPLFAETLLANADADLVAMGRPLLGDPQFAKKVMERRANDIRRCISCEYCIDSMQTNNNLSCAINPLLGREHKLPFKSGYCKKVLVVGGGVAGMEAARLAALAGHSVVLLEKMPRLGGSLILAAVLNPDNESYLDWLRTQLQQLPIEIHTHCHATATMILSHAPDVVIVATGAKVDVPEIPGIDRPHVVSGSRVQQIYTSAVEPKRGGYFSRCYGHLLNKLSPYLYSLISIQLARRFSRLWMPIGKRVIVIGADIVGVQSAIFLAERGRYIHLLESTKKIVPEVGKKKRYEYMDRLDRLNIVINTGVSVVRIDKYSVLIRAGEKESRLDYDSVIVVGKAVACKQLSGQLRDLGMTVHNIGDSTGFGMIAKATRSAADIVSQL